MLKQGTCIMVIIKFFLYCNCQTLVQRINIVMKEILQKDHGYYKKIMDVYTTYIDYAIKVQKKKHLSFSSTERQENSSILSYFNIKKLWKVMRSIVYVLLLR